MSSLFTGMLVSPLCLSQFFKHHVSQVVQAFSKLNRIDQGPAAPVVAVQTVQVRTGDQERGNASAVGSDPHPVQTAAHAQQKCAFVQIGHFDGTLHKGLTSFQILVFFGEMR
jgi:hypothetical protein